MSRPILFSVFTVLGLGLAVTMWVDAQGGVQPGVVQGPDCVKVSGQAIYRSGYTHTVRVRNECPGTAHCQVSTDVDPRPTYHLAVPAGETREQITRIGSPAYEFQARATCTVEGMGDGSGSGGGGGD